MKAINTNNFAFAILSIIMLASCSTTKQNVKDENKLPNDNFDVRGKYSWSFNLGDHKQTSTNVFYRDSSVYSMNGSVYSTNYTIYKLSYNKKDKRWIGEDDNGTIYLHFFRNLTDSTLTIYKRKCKKEGLKEALEFSIPSDTTNADHGWNIYTKKKPFLKNKA